MRAAKTSLSCSSLVPVPFDAPPAQRVGQQPGQHGRRRKGTDNAVVVNRLAAEGHQRAFQVQEQVPHCYPASPLRTVSAAHDAKSSRQTRSACGISQSSTDITRRASFAP